MRKLNPQSMSSKKPYQFERSCLFQCMLLKLLTVLHMYVLGEINIPFRSDVFFKYDYVYFFTLIMHLHGSLYQVRIEWFQVCVCAHACVHPCMCVCTCVSRKQNRDIHILSQSLSRLAIMEFDILFKQFSQILPHMLRNWGARQK